MLSHRRLCACLFLPLLVWLAGCVSSHSPAPAPGVPKAREARWAVVPLAVQDTTVNGFERTSLHADAAEAVPRVLEEAGQAHRLAGDPSAGDALRVGDVYRRSEVDTPNGVGLAPRLAAFDSLQAVSGCRYILTIHAVRWSKTPGRIAAELGISALSAVAGAAAGRRDLFVLPTAPSAEVILGLALVDVRRREVVARQMIESSTSEIDWVVSSALTALFTGRFLSPASFGVRTSDDVIVYRNSQPEIVGSGFRIEGLEAVVERDGDSTQRLPVHTVSKVKSTTRNRTIFPREQ